MAELIVVLLDGQLDRSVTVGFSTENGGALGTFADEHNLISCEVILIDGVLCSIDPEDYSETAVQLEFTPGTQRLSVFVSITDDDVVEQPEVFFGVLNDMGSPVLIDPSRANVTIVDDGKIMPLYRYLWIY